jgi:hypothetical protein
LLADVVCHCRIRGKPKLQIYANANQQRPTSKKNLSSTRYYLPRSCRPGFCACARFFDRIKQFQEKSEEFKLAASIASMQLLAIHR